MGEDKNDGFRLESKSGASGADDPFYSLPEALVAARGEPGDVFGVTIRDKQPSWRAVDGADEVEVYREWRGREWSGEAGDGSDGGMEDDAGKGFKVANIGGDGPAPAIKREAGKEAELSVEEAEKGEL